ncbi:MAG: DUF2064 domain-containing protein [Acidobacteria bacterium]|nr:DUF2064 domain-containing protein [Acidobacteriota bacterium]
MAASRRSVAGHLRYPINTPPAKSGRRAGTVGLLATIGGFALFGYYLREAGVGTVADDIGELGWTFGLVIVLSGLRFAARALAWLRCLPPGHGLGLRNLLPAFVAGDAVANLTPLSLVAGEPVKVLYLQDRAPLGRTVPALAVETLFYTLSMVVVVGAGAVALVMMVQPPASEWLLYGLPLATLVLFVAGAHWLIWNRVRAASAPLRWLARRGVATALLERAADRARDAESRVHRDYPRTWPRVLLVASLEMSFHALAVAEAYVVLSVIGARTPTLVEVFVFEAVNRLVNVIFKVVPLRIGVDQAGTAAVAALLGFGETTGVTLATTRTARMLVWMAAGMAVLARRGLSPRKLAAEKPGPATVTVMARSPGGARAPKSRLRQAVPAEADRRRLYAAFLADTVAIRGALPDVAWHVACAPGADADGFAPLGIDRTLLLPQRGDDLGARERNLFEDLFAAGFTRVVLIGSDLPTLPAEHVADALARLRPGTVTLGPAADGGYYLIGLTAPDAGDAVPDLFTSVRWGTSSAFEDTVRAAARSGIAVERIAGWYDVDDADGMERLRRDVGPASEETRAPATARVLERLTAEEALSRTATGRNDDRD